MATNSKSTSSAETEVLEPRRRVGDILRSARLAKDMDLKEVSEKLCIRRAFLEAIENSKPQDLPGTTYALGFVRTYAEHLNMDPKPLIDQFKVEAAELEQQTHLHFPEPLPAKSLPGGALVFIGLLLLAIFYGIWWYLNNEGKSIMDLVPDVPEQFSGMVEEGEAIPTTMDRSEPAMTAPAEATPPSETAETANETAPVSEGIAAATPIEPSGSTETAETVTEETAPAAPAEETAAVEQPATDSATVAEEEPQQPEAEETAAAETTVEPAASEGETAATPEAAPEEPAAAEEEPVAAAPAAPSVPQPQLSSNNKVFGEENADARVVITAKSTAWVEITGPTGQRLLTRLMNQGDQYRVPNVKGVTLVTGNAGALEISVDGAPGKPLGPTGAVRRDVSLDPEALAAVQ